MNKLWMLLLISTILPYSVVCLQRELTVNVDAGSEECFFQQVNKAEVIDLEYQVTDGGHGEPHITFRLSDPTGRILEADFKKDQNNHRVEALQTGDYKFCFDNTFSMYNSKSVFFELIVEKEDDDEWDSEENIDFSNEELNTETYDMQVQDIQEVITRVHSHLKQARHLQDMFKSHEARDRNVAEENFFKVNSFSIVQVIIMLSVGVIQVIMVRSLFDDSSKAHKIWKKLDSGR